MRILLFMLYSIICLSQIVDATKENNNIVLSGGGCKGSGALVMENGKGKKKEKIIISDDALVMQDGEADGNLIMDGNNLVFKEGKKNENIVIKGNGGHCCHHDVVHHENHVTIHHKKKKVHHRNDLLGWRNKGEKLDTQQQKEKSNLITLKIKSEEKKIPKLKLGEKLSFKEKENLEIQRADKRLGRFKLAEMVMEKIRLRKKAKNNSSNDKSKKIKKDEQQSTKEDTESNGEQYEDDDVDNYNKDQEEEEMSSSNLYEALTNVIYPVLNSASTGYMTSSNSMINLYSPSPIFEPVTDRRDLKKKYEGKKNKNEMFKNLNDVKEHIEGNKIETTEYQKSLTSISNDYNDKNNDEKNLKPLNNNEPRDNQTSKESRSIESGSKSINYFTVKAITQKTNSLDENKIVQPVFTPDERQQHQVSNQLTPTLDLLLALTTNIQQRLALSDHYSQNAALPLFAPTKSPLENSAALLLPLIAHQSNRQRKLIRAQQKLLTQLRQENAKRDKQNFNDLLIKQHNIKKDSNNEISIYENKKKNNSKILYLNESEKNDNESLSNTHSDYDKKFNKNDKPLIYKSRKRKIEENLSRPEIPNIIMKDGNRDKYASRRFKKSKENIDDKFDSFDFKKDLMRMDVKNIDSKNEKQSIQINEEKN